MGHDIDEWVDKNGYPKKSFVAPNGNKVYVFHRERPGPIFYGHGSIRPMPNYHCTTYLEVDNRGIIVRYRWEGNNCE